MEVTELSHPQHWQLYMVAMHLMFYCCALHRTNCKRLTAHGTNRTKQTKYTLEFVSLAKYLLAYKTEFVFR